MSQKLTCVQAYKAMLHFLGTIYFETYDEFLSDILSGGALYSEDDGQKPETMDPAIWGDWVDGLKKVMHDDTIKFDATMLTIQQAYAAVYQYLVVYCNMGAEPSIFILRDFLGEDFNQSNITRWLEKKWIKSIKYISQETLTEKIGHFFGEKTLVSKESSFKIMQFFLDNYCQQNDNQDLIDLVKNSRMKQFDEESITKSHVWIIWQQALAQAMDKENCKELNLLVAFYAMAFFLLDYFDEDRVTILENMILKFAIDKDSKPVYFSFWRNWTSAAVKFNAQQMELINNLISINTPVSTKTSFKIIQAWLEYKKDLVGTDIVQQVISDTQRIEQAIDEIKQQPRSYLLLDDEVTVLETYHIMLKLLELQGLDIPYFAIDAEQGHKPKDFIILLEWIRISEQMIK